MYVKFAIMKSSPSLLALVANCAFVVGHGVTGTMEFSGATTPEGLNVTLYETFGVSKYNNSCINTNDLIHTLYKGMLEQIRTRNLTYNPRDFDVVHDEKLTRKSPLLRTRVSHRSSQLIMIKTKSVFQDGISYTADAPVGPFRDIDQDIDNLNPLPTTCGPILPLSSFLCPPVRKCIKERSNKSYGWMEYLMAFNYLRRAARYVRRITV